MQCKQCGNPNEDRAIECAACGAGLRRPYPYDALGTWLERLESEVNTSTKGLWTGLVVAAFTVIGAPFALVGFDVVNGWVPAFAIILGLVCTVMGLTALMSRLSMARGRERFRTKVHPALQELYRETDMQRWRVGVLIQESLPRRSAINLHFVAGELPDDGKP